LKGETQRDIAEAQAKNGDATGALKTTDMIIDNDMKSVALSRIAVVQAKGGNVTGALQIADLIQSQDRRGAALQTIAKRQTQNGNLDGAQNTVDLILDVRYQKEAQQVVDVARLKAGTLLLSGFKDWRTPTLTTKDL